MERARVRPVLPLALALVCVLAACSSDWATWGNGPARHGENALERTINTSNVGQLAEKWSVDLGAISNTAPIVASNLNVDGTTTDVIYVGTEHGMFYAISAAGQVLWSKNLGSQTTGCSDTPDGTFGVSASATFDRAGNRVFVAGGDGYIHAFDPVTGDTIAGWPVQYTTAPAKEVVWGGLVLVGDHLYVPIGSQCSGRPYHGRVVDISPTSTSIVNTWWTLGGPDAASGGGVWGWGGVAVDTKTGDLFLATGNAFPDPPAPENIPYADAVVRLNSSLQLQAADQQPVTVVNDDFGSTPVLFQAPNCPPQFAIIRKEGALYLYDRDSIAGGPSQRIAFGKSYLFSNVAYSGSTNMVYATNANGSADGTYIKGVAAFKVNASCRLQLAWQTPLSLSNAVAPSVANGVLFVPGGVTPAVYALNALTGEKLWDSSSGTTLAGRVFAQPVVQNGTVYVTSWDNHLHAWSVPAPPPSATTTTAP
jgi:outer membrane protein assembly factor BamB